MARRFLLSLILTIAPQLCCGAAVVYRFDLHDEMIDPATVFYFVRAYAHAEEASADAVIIDIDTPGGRVDSMLEIRNRIIESPLRTYAYVHAAISAGALVALSTDGIYMAPGSTIGGAQPILGTGAELAPSVDAKITSILRSEVRATLRELARKNPSRWTEEQLDYVIQVSEAFITPPSEDVMSIYVSGEVVCHKDELLTMDWEQAVQEHLAVARVETFDDVVRDLGYESAQVRQVNLTWSEELARFLTKSSVTALLLLVGLLGIYLEIKTPGFGLPGIVGITALTLFFFGAYVADLATIVEPLMVIAGIILLGIEVFVLPGFGLPGILGILLIVFGLLLALVRLPPPEFEFSLLYFRAGLTTLALTFVLLIIAVTILAKYLPKSSLWRRLELQPATTSPPTVPLPPGVDKSPVTPGATGRALSDLRPAGRAEIAGEPYDVVTAGEYIERGSAIRVTQVTGSRVQVAAAPPEQRG
jgi:membrane-bound serine protease (ClpP class)